MQYMMLCPIWCGATLCCMYPVPGPVSPSPTRPFLFCVQARHSIAFKSSTMRRGHKITQCITHCVSVLTLIDRSFFFFLINYFPHMALSCLVPGDINVDAIIQIYCVTRVACVGFARKAKHCPPVC